MGVVQDGLNSITTSTNHANDLKIINNQYQISGIDPFIDFNLPKPIKTQEKTLIELKLQCNDNSKNIPVQLFWLEENATGYTEQNSIHLTLPTGIAQLQLNALADNKNQKDIKRIRLDIDAKNQCSVFSIENPKIYSSLH